MRCSVEKCPCDLQFFATSVPKFAWMLQMDSKRTWGKKIEQEGVLIHGVHSCPCASPQASIILDWDGRTEHIRSHWHWHQMQELKKTVQTALLYTSGAGAFGLFVDASPWFLETFAMFIKRQVKHNKSTSLCANTQTSLGKSIVGPVILAQFTKMTVFLTNIRRAPVDNRWLRWTSTVQRSQRWAFPHNMFATWNLHTQHRCISTCTAIVKCVLCMLIWMYAVIFA